MSPTQHPLLTVAPVHYLIAVNAQPVTVSGSMDTGSRANARLVCMPASARLNQQAQALSWQSVVFALQHAVVMLLASLLDVYSPVSGSYALHASWLPYPRG